jgi:hypothetical protein
MKKILLFFFVSLLAFGNSVYAQQKPDFSGTWVLDIAGSDLGGASKAATKQGQMYKISLIVTQTAKQLTIKRSTGDTAVYNLDGSDSINNLPNGNQAVTRMKWDGDRLVAKTTANMGGQTIEMTDVRSLDTSGRIMTVHLTRQTPRGEMKQTLIYNKHE